METEDFQKQKNRFLVDPGNFINKDITVEESVRELHQLLIDKKSLLADIEKNFTVIITS